MRPSFCVKQMSSLKAALDALYAARSPHHLANDPLSFCHRYKDPHNQEIAAVIAAAFAYGNIAIILRTLESIFIQLGPSLRRSVEDFDPVKGLKLFSTFKHRFNDGSDLCALLLAIQSMIKQTGTVEAFFLRSYRENDPDLTNAINGYSSSVLALDYSTVFGTPEIPENSYFRFLFPAPVSGSACKRLCMFLRWMVRHSDGIDLGIWHAVSPSQLIIPVDTHISRICRYLGFTSRKSADWRMAGEITAALRQLDPLDPVKYDFVIAHLGISENCDGKDDTHCRTCQIREICPQIRANRH